MKTVISIDSFKGSLSSLEAGCAAAEGIKRVYPDAETVISPIADGGEGTLDAVVSATEGKIIEVEVTGPLGKKRVAHYGVLSSDCVMVEIAEAAGLTLINADERDPMLTTTFGVGEIIRDAIKRGYRNFTVGLGGSATNDGGVGMLQALGFSFLDTLGNEIPRGAAGLERLATINCENALPELSECRFTLACDVKNVLCGESGCTRIFSLQKGARECDLERMDKWISSYADIVKTLYPSSDKNSAGSGAAGGLGFAFMSFLGAEMKSGIEVVTELTRLEDHIKTADIIVTGEGRLDRQTSMGKAPVGVAAIAKKYSKCVIAFSGCIGEGAEELCNHGIDAYFPILRKPCSLEEAMKYENAYKNMSDTAEQVFRLVRMGDTK